MVTDAKGAWKRQVVLGAILSLLCVSMPEAPALADTSSLEQPREAGSSSIKPSPQKIEAARTSAKKSRGKPSQSGNFIYEIISRIRSQSQELCTRYGSPSDCLEEAEVCLTMRDTEDNLVRLCLNSTPGESERNGDAAQRTRLRR
jgi:hypothetical protein